MKSNKTGRIIELLTALQAEHQYTAADLATALGTSRRTIFRDLKSLQEAGVKYAFNPKGKSYFADCDFTLPSLNLTAEEAFALLLLVYKGSNQINFPLRKALLIAGLKIENNLHSDIRKYCSNAIETISMQPNPTDAQELPDKIFGQIQKAIMNKKQIKINFYSAKENTEIDKIINPFHLLYSMHNWHLIGKSEKDKQITTIKLCHIRKVIVLSSNYTEELSFDIQDYLGRAWSILPEGRLYNVKLQFATKIAYDVTSVKWHETQTSYFQHDGSAIVEFRVDGLNEITWWILSYGDQVEVIAPRALRKRIIQIAQKISS